MLTLYSRPHDEAFHDGDESTTVRSTDARSLEATPSIAGQGFTHCPKPIEPGPTEATSL